MCVMEHRLHILLDDRRYRKVARAAEQKGVSVAAIIREAIECLPDSADTRRAAFDRILGAEPIPVPKDPADLRAELDEAHDRILS
jgi:hypothetical protein